MECCAKVNAHGVVFRGYASLFVGPALSYRGIENWWRVLRWRTSCWKLRPAIASSGTCYAVGSVGIKVGEECFDGVRVRELKIKLYVILVWKGELKAA